MHNNSTILAACRSLLFLLCLGTVNSMLAAGITGVKTVNVTPTSFSVLWRATPSTPSIEIYSDAAGQSPVLLTAQAFPVHTGSPDAQEGYYRRQSQVALQQKTRAANLSMIRVTGCAPGTTYYYRLVSTPVSGPALTYPVSGDLPAVTTEIENTFVVNDQQLWIEVPGLDTAGQIAVLTHPNAKNPLAAVVGDGAGPNQVIFNLNDLFAASGAPGNFAPIGAQDFDLSVMSAGAGEAHEVFTVTFSSDFLVARTTQSTVGTEFVAASVGNTVVRVGDSGSVPLTFNSSVAVASLDLRITVPPGRLDQLALQNLPPEVDTAGATVNLQQTTNIVVHLPMKPGLPIAGTKNLGNLAFRAAPGQDSAFAHLVLRQITASKTDLSPVSTLFGNSGRVVIVGSTTLIEGQTLTNGGKSLVLYALPGKSCALEYATNIVNPVWTRLGPVAVTNLVNVLTPWYAPSVPTLYFRGVEFFADPPILQAAPAQDGTRRLTLFGKPGSTYSILMAEAITVPMTWTESFRTTLTSSFAFLQLTNPAGVFFDVKETTAVAKLDIRPNSLGNGYEFVLSGRVGASYLIESSRLTNPGFWSSLLRVPMTASPLVISRVAPDPSGALYRVSEFNADPPILEAFQHPNQSRELVLYGKSEQSYTIEARNSFSNIVVWQPFSTNRLPASFSYSSISVNPTNGTIFFRVKKD